MSVCPGGKILFSHASRVALGTAMPVNMSISQFGPDWNISTVLMDCCEICTDIHGSLRMSPSDFVYPVAFLVPPAGQSFHLFSEISQHLNELAQNLQFPDDKSYWLWWSTDLFSSSIKRFTVFCIFCDTSHTFMFPPGWIVITSVIP